MIDFSGRGILLDIEGTTSSIHFVYDVMFPFARRHLERFLREQWYSQDVQEACQAIARHAGHPSLQTWCGTDDAVQRRCIVRQEVERLMDNDVKATGLKYLQGLIWQSGFESGEMQAHLYDDVRPALTAWNAAGRDVRIYSSGSIQAQRLFFGHTIEGDLLPLFHGHYDTTTGSKKLAASYETIAGDYALPAEEILFVSDVTDELDAARQCGMHTALCRRPENPLPPSDHGHPEIRSFDQIVLH